MQFRGVKSKNRTCSLNFLGFFLCILFWFPTFAVPIVFTCMKILFPGDSYPPAHSRHLVSSSCGKRFDYKYCTRLLRKLSSVVIWPSWGHVHVANTASNYRYCTSSTLFLLFITACRPPLLQFRKAVTNMGRENGIDKDLLAKALFHSDQTSAKHSVSRKRCASSSRCQAEQTCVVALLVLE